MNEDAFLSALHESPGDEVTWAALADWLDEDGQSERAELVRLVRRLRALPVMRRTKARAALEGRVTELLHVGVRPVVPEITDSIGMRFARIEPGRFRIGSPREEKDRHTDEDVRQVTLTRPFYLGVFLVTQQQYEMVTGVNPSYCVHKDIGEEELASFPVEQVSWEDIQAFLGMLDTREKAAKGRLHHRLPTEAEWEYVCRAGTETPYHFGQEITREDCNHNGVHGRSCKVGSYPANAFGLYDMHGNVWEWVQDYWNGDKYPARLRPDPTGPATGHGRVVRGGGWQSSPSDCRSAERCWNPPTVRNRWLGFRVAADVRKGVRS